MDESKPSIGIYEYIDYGQLDEVYQPYDQRFPEVAARLIALIEEVAPGVRVEHIGSSAIPGCAGKGVVDLMVLYQPGGLEAARDAVDRLGFQRQRNRNSFPEERPVRLGTIEHEGKTYRIHAHVVAADAEEAVEQIVFRETLRADPALVGEYEGVKRQVVARGSIDNVAYNEGKEAFIQRILRMARETPGSVE